MTETPSQDRRDVGEVQTSAAEVHFSDVSASPLLRIVKGDPTPEEVAALVSVVSALAAGAEAAAGKSGPRPEWGAHHRRLRGIHRHGPGAWRASAR